jgi:nickel/cobalt tolerance cation efflux system protein
MAEARRLERLTTIQNLLIDVGSKIPLSQVASVLEVHWTQYNRENVSRLLVVSANVKGKIFRSVIESNPNTSQTSK